MPKEKKFSQEDIQKALDYLYQKSKTGIEHVSPPIEQMADDYLKKHRYVNDAIKDMLNYQVAKCTTSGFITGLGGVISLPVAIPANIGSVLYVQMRMIACTAYMAGYDMNSDQIQTFVYACLAGVSVNEVIKQFGVNLGEKFAVAAIRKIPGKTLNAINQKVMFRFITKFGETGVINLGKMVPVVGGIVNGSLDLAETKVIANRAYKQFVQHDFTPDKHETVIDLDVSA